MAARGVPRTTVDGWYRDRARTGHPEKAGRIGRTDYWYEDEWTAWHEAHRRGKIESLTLVDRSGDPDDLVDAAEAARMLRCGRELCALAGVNMSEVPENRAGLSDDDFPRAVVTSPPAGGSGSGKGPPRPAASIV